MKEDGPKMPIDRSEMKLPAYYDKMKFKRWVCLDENFNKLQHNAAFFSSVFSAQRMYSRNYFVMMYGMYLGVIAILSIPSILSVLMATKKSSSVITAYKRYLQTVFHTISWYRKDLEPESESWRSLKMVRNMHFSVGFVSQRDMVLTQFSFMGFFFISRKELNIQCSDEEMKNLCHFWRVLGHLHGITDEFNLCCESFDETLERLQIIKTDFFIPALSNCSDEFIEISKYAVSALQCYDIVDFYEPIIFNVKRLIGLPDYYYLESEIPENYDRTKLKYLQLSYIDRVNLFLSVITRQFLVKYWIIRWFYNCLMYIAELSIRYFPIVAIIRFGPRKAYVRIWTGCHGPVVENYWDRNFFEFQKRRPKFFAKCSFGIS